MISKLSNSGAEQKAYYRLLENTKFSDDLIKNAPTVNNMNSAGFTALVADHKAEAYDVLARKLISRPETETFLS